MPSDLTAFMPSDLTVFMLQTFQHGLELTFASSAEATQLQTCPPQNKGRHSGDIEGLCGLGTTIHIDLEEGDVRVLQGQSIKDRCNHLAGSAPRGREVNEVRLAVFNLPEELVELVLFVGDQNVRHSGVLG